MLDLFALSPQGWGDEILAGLWMTMRLALATLPVGLLIGFAVAGLTLSGRGPLRALGFGYTTLMRGLPEILTLFIVYNGLGIGLNALLARFGAEPAELSPFFAGVVALALVFGAFAAEVLRGAFQSLPEGQIMAGRAIGMTPRQIFFRIKLPLMWRFALPGLGNLWMNLLKDTALVSVIALDDLMRATKVAVGVTKQPFTFYLAACLLYWLMCLASEAGLARLEKRAARGLGRA